MVALTIVLSHARQDDQRDHVAHALERGPEVASRRSR